MRIRDIAVHDVAAGRNWRLTDGPAPSMLDWEIEPCAHFRDGDTVVYSALAVVGLDAARPMVLIREMDYEWWGDTCEFVDGAWSELGAEDEPSDECFVADPLSNDPSFMGEYSHEKQRAGFCSMARQADAHRVIDTRAAEP